MVTVPKKPYTDNSPYKNARIDSVKQDLNNAKYMLFRAKQNYAYYKKNGPASKAAVAKSNIQIHSKGVKFYQRALSYKKALKAKRGGK